MQWMFRKYFIWKPMDFSVSRVQFGTGVQLLVERAFNSDGEYICYCRSTQVFCIHTHGMFDMYVCGMRIYTWRSVILRLCVQTTKWHMSKATHYRRALWIIININQKRIECFDIYAVSQRFWGRPILLIRLKSMRSKRGDPRIVAIHISLAIADCTERKEFEFLRYQPQRQIAFCDGRWEAMLTMICSVLPSDSQARIIIVCYFYNLFVLYFFFVYKIEKKSTQ